MKQGSSQDHSFALWPLEVPPFLGSNGPITDSGSYCEEYGWKKDAARDLPSSRALDTKDVAARSKRTANGENSGNINLDSGSRSSAMLRYARLVVRQRVHSHRGMAFLGNDEQDRAAEVLLAFAHDRRGWQ